ncbi:unnamed protein product [Haemonchus placei]|uniref:Mariner Mos1 transposase n=1 Tax=Haemonchus placei TaxID=6290 RepID=A0A0N4WAK1_HAEPC|nr:unnamed protein product [Haemonchus placei]
MLDEECTVTAHVNISQLRNLKANPEATRPQQHKVYFQHDNARPHIARTTKTEVPNFGRTSLPHQPCSSDLDPTDYHFFPHLQRHLDGQEFQIRNDIKMALEQFSKGQLPAF